jgi:hypothetical protein
MNLLQTIFPGRRTRSAVEYIARISGTSPMLSPAAGDYSCSGEILSPTNANAPASVVYLILFQSGVVQTPSVFLAFILGLDRFYAKTDMIYEISVLNNLAAVGMWEVPENDNN